MMFVVFDHFHVSIKYLSGFFFGKLKKFVFPKFFLDKKRFTVMCTNTAVRLVSSGQYDNQIEFGYEPMLDFEPPVNQPASLICPINQQDQ